MAPLKEKIEQDLNHAMKNRESLRVSTCRMLLAEIHNQEIQNKGALSEDQILTVLRAAAKKHQDSISSFQKGGRSDLVAKEEDELKIVQAYLPKPVSEERLREIVQKVIQKLDAKAAGDFGKVMQAVIAEVKGQAQGALVSRIVKEELK